jgi:hypothetical protein
MRPIALVPGLLATTAACVAAALGIGLAAVAPRPACAVEVESDVPVRVGDLQRLKVGSVQITPNVFKIEGEGAIFLVNTSEGSVLIDIGYDSPQALEQKKLIEKLATGPIRKIILTHSHIDHVGGLRYWEKEIAAGTETVGHQRYAYMGRLQAEPLEFSSTRRASISTTTRAPPTGRLLRSGSSTPARTTSSSSAARSSS